MRWTSKIAAAALAALLQACATAPVAAPPPALPAATAEARAPVTILVSIDAFRADYLKRGVTPNLSALAASGIAAPMRPSFPTKTFPNHWTLVTGVYPDRHGIIANRMEDPARPGEVFTTASDDPFWWNAATPVWVDAEKAGIRTGSVLWPGSNVAIGAASPQKGKDVEGGTRSSDWLQYNGAITDTQRVNTVLDWMRRPASIRPKFVTLYFDVIDRVTHDVGPDDPRATEAVAQIDATIGSLIDGLAALGQPANLVIVSDHGMAQTSTARLLPLDQWLKPEDYHLIEASTFLSVIPAPGREAAVEKALLGKHPHFECWRKSEIPARFHYGANSRVTPVFCLAATGWLFADKPPKAEGVGGNHGYDNLAPEMAALFIASGPAFRHMAIASFDNVDVYPLLLDLIGLPPKPGVDGTDAPFREALVR